MSDDQLDDDLKNRIKQVFDNYEDDTAKEGWLLLREKYPEKEEENRVIFWLWRVAGVAAILLVLLSIGLWLNYHPVNKESIALRTKKVKKADSAVSTISAIAKNKNEQAGSTTNTATNQQPANVVKPAYGAAIGTTSVAANTAATPTYSSANKNTAANSATANTAGAPVYSPVYPSTNKNTAANTIAANTGGAPVYSPAYPSANKKIAANTIATATGGAPVFSPGYPSANNNTAANVTKVDNSAKTGIAYQSTNKAKTNSLIDSPVTIANNKTGFTLIPTGPVKKQTENNQPKVLATAPPARGMQALFDKESKAAPVTEEKKLIDKKVLFGIYAATYVNYAKGSNKQFNTGAGITSDIRLTENLSISTGISVGQNTLSYNSSVAYPQIAMALATTSSHNFAADGNALPALVPSSKDLNANLVNLDIPVDLKYTFTQRKGTTYVAAGFSSGTFINETYSTTYNYSVGNNSSAQQSQDATHKTFDSFYLAQMVNVSFGVGYPLGKNQLIIEPFFKYPLNGLGDQHILFGSGGINLKFNFDPPKK
jgi:hypothetical protein